MTEIFDALYKHYEKDNEHIKKGNNNHLKNVKQKVLDILNKSIKDDTKVLLIGESHTCCPHSGLETMAIRELNKKTGYDPIVFHEGFSEYNEKELSKKYKILKKMPKIKDTFLKNFDHLNKAKNMKVIHIPKDHIEYLFNKALENLDFDTAKKLDFFKETYKKFPQHTINGMRIFDQTYSLNGKIIGCDIKNKLDVNTYDKNLGKKIKDKKTSKVLGSYFNLFDGTIKMRDKKMAEIISENLEKGTLHIGIFGAAHIDGIKKNLEKKDIKVKTIKLKPFGYKEHYNLL